MQSSSNLKSLVLWGASGHAKVLAEVASRLGYQVTALFDNAPVSASPLNTVAVHQGREGFFRWLKETAPADPIYCQAAIGGSRGGARTELLSFMQTHGLTPVTLIHPTAYVAADAVLGNAVQILAQAVVCTEATLGAGCIVNTNASVDHECQLEPGVHVAPGATLCGCVTVRKNAFIGAGAVILPRLTIGSDAVVGAGAVVTKDVPAGAVVYGNPARPAVAR